MLYYAENIKKFYFKEELSKKVVSLTIPSVYVVIGTPSFRETKGEVLSVFDVPEEEIDSVFEF